MMRPADEQRARERLRLNHYHLWKALTQGEEDPGLLQKWRHAPRGSQGWRSLILYEQARRVVEVSSRE
jgi:hypothetical protein